MFGVPSLDVKLDTFTLKWLPKWVGRHISHVNTPSWWRSLFIPTINATHLCCVWCLLQVSMTDLRCDSESVVMVRHRVSTQVIHDIGWGMLPQSRVFVIYWTYSCKLSKQASYVLRKYFFLVASHALWIRKVSLYLYLFIWSRASKIWFKSGKRVRGKRLGRPPNKTHPQGIIKVLFYDRLTTVHFVATGF